MSHGKKINHLLSANHFLCSSFERYFCASYCSLKNITNNLMVRKILCNNTRLVLLQEMIDEADRDGDGEINEAEFLRIMKKTSLY